MSFLRRDRRQALDAEKLEDLRERVVGLALQLLVAENEYLFGRKVRREPAQLGRIEPAVHIGEPAVLIGACGAQTRALAWSASQNGNGSMPRSRSMFQCEWARVIGLRSTAISFIAGLYSQMRLGASFQYMYAGVISPTI